MSCDVVKVKDVSPTTEGIRMEHLGDVCFGSTRDEELDLRNLLDPISQGGDNVGLPFTAQFALIKPIVDKELEYPRPSMRSQSGPAPASSSAS